MRISNHTKKIVLKTSKGAITLLLILSILPVFSTIAVLVEAERYQNAVRAVDEALGSSALSTLSQYDTYLLQRFGLLAVKQTTDRDFMSSQVNRYLQLQKTTDMAGAGLSTMTANVEGVYPIADISTLRQQILSYSNVLVPAKIVSDFGEFDNLIGQIEGLFGKGIVQITHLIDSGAGMLDNEIDLFENIDAAKAQMGTVGTAIDAYENKFTAFETAMNNLAEHTATDCPDREEDEEGADKWEETLQRLRQEAKAARDAYSEALAQAQDEIGGLHDKLGDALDSKTQFAGSIAQVTADVASSGPAIDYDTTDSKNRQIIDKDLTSIVDSVKEGGESVIETVGDTLDTLRSENFDNAILELERVKGAVDGLNFETENGYAGSEKASYHDVNVDLSVFRDTSKLDDLINEMNNMQTEESGIDGFLALFDILGSLFNTKLFNDGELSVTLSDGVYRSLPSRRDRNSAAYSLESPYEQADEARAKEILEEIDPDYDPDDPFGDSYANSTQSKIDELINAIMGLLETRKNLEESEWIVGKLEAYRDCLTQCREIFEAVMDFNTVLTQALQSVYERTLIMGYMAYNLPNRTNYDSGSTLTGYSYVNAALAPSRTGTNYDTSFSGAELEYIMSGQRSETTNQLNVFCQIYLTRFFLDIVPVLTNSEIQHIGNACAAVPYVGAVLAIVYYTVVLLVEPLIDCYVLVNGGGVNLYKLQSKDVYFAPSGVVNLLETVSSLKLTPTKKSEIREKVNKYANKYTGTTNLETETGTDTNSDKPETPSFSTEKWAEEVWKLDYTQHAFILMMLFGNETQYLNRLVDLAQLEGKYQSQHDGATYTQKVLGEYVDFDVDRAYTTMRVEASGTLRQLLPVPALDGSGTTLFGSPFRYHRVLYRGY